MGSSTNINNMAGQSIVVDRVQELDKLKKVEWVKTSGEAPYSWAGSARSEWYVSRIAEAEKGSLSAIEWDYFANRYLRQLPAWNAIYLQQVVEYKIEDFTEWKEYKEAYDTVLDMLTMLKINEPLPDKAFSFDMLIDKEGRKYDWAVVWKTFYDKSDALDILCYSKSKSTCIVKAINRYAINTSEETPPSWQTEADDVNWSQDKPSSKKVGEVMWGSIKYYYGDGVITRGQPFIVMKKGTGESTEEDEDNKTLMLALNYPNVEWTKRGTKNGRKLTVEATCDDPASIQWTTSSTKVKVQDTEQVNIKEIITPLLAGEMPDSVNIIATLKDAKQSVSLYKMLTGTAEASYLGMHPTYPLEYIHDGVADNLVVGDWFLCTEEDKATDFLKYGNVYECIDVNKKGTEAGWKLCEDTKKITACREDAMTLDPDKLEGTQISGMNLFANKIIASEINVLKTLEVKGDSVFRNIYPEETSKYVIGSSGKKWSNLYTNTLNATTANTSSITNTGTIKTSYVLPNSNNSGYVGTTGNYFLAGAMTSLYANYLKTISGGYHLFSSPSTETSTTWYVHNSGATSETSSRQTGGTISWTGLIINSYPMKFAILTGNGTRTYKGTPNVVDKILQFYLPTNICKFKSASYNSGYAYQARVSTVYDAWAGSGMQNNFGIPLVLPNSDQPSWQKKNLSYFCTTADVISNGCSGFQILVLGFIE